jgi:hypothetical protein
MQNDAGRAFRSGARAPWDATHRQPCATGSWWPSGVASTEIRTNCAGATIESILHGRGPAPPWDVANVQSKGHCSRLAQQPLLHRQRDLSKSPYGTNHKVSRLALKA